MLSSLLINVAYDSCHNSSRLSSSISPGGDFLSFLRKRKDELKLKQLVRFSLDVAAGMLYLESKTVYTGKELLEKVSLLLPQPCKTNTFFCNNTVDSFHKVYVLLFTFCVKTFLDSFPETLDSSLTRGKSLIRKWFNFIVSICFIVIVNSLTWPTLKSESGFMCCCHFLKSWNSIIL